jgi:tight adherence protein B
MTSPTARRPARRRGRIALVLGAAVAVVLGGVSTALAADTAPPAPTVLQVDATTEATSVVVRTGSPAQDVQVRVNGRAAQISAIEPQSTGSVKASSALVLDSSAAGGSELDAMKASAKAFIEGIMPGEEISLVTSGGGARVALGFTSDKSDLLQALAAVSPSGQSSLWASIVQASDLFTGRSNRIGNVVVFTATGDTLPNSTPVAARGAALSQQVAVHFRIIQREDFAKDQLGSMASIARTTGGSMQTSPTIEAFGATKPVGERVRNLTRVAFQSAETAKGGNLAVTVDGGTSIVGFLPGTVTKASALAPIEHRSDPLPLIGGSLGLWLGVALGAAAIGMAVWATVSLLDKGDDALQSVLSPYAASTDTGPKGSNALARNALFQRAVHLTGNVAERQGFLTKAESLLERAALPLRAAEALTFYVGIVIGGVVLAVALTGGNLLGTIVIAAIAAVAPYSVVSAKANKRRKKFVAQLPDTMQLLAGTLKAGYSFMQGVEAVSQEVEEPMGGELRRVVSEAQLGRPVEEALDGSAERMGSEDFAWAVMAVRIQREVGGNLAELLLTVADTMVARQRLRGEVSALTAEGRMSAIVLGALPVLLGVAMWVINPEYMGVLFSATAGKVMLVTAIVAALAGFYWMKRIIDIRI